MFIARNILRVKLTDLL